MVSRSVLRDIINDSDLDEIVQRDLTHKFCQRYITIEGVTLPEQYLAIQEKVDNFDVSENDVWVCSFPKTGTTWTQEMVWMIMNNLDFVRGQVGIMERSPFFESSALIDADKLRETGFEPFFGLEDSVTCTKKCSKEGPTVIKTHLPWALLPKEIKEDNKTPKIVYVTRNPKDTCISYFYHTILATGCRPKLEDFCRLFLAGKLLYAPFWDHVLSFWERRNQSNVLFIRYEDMIKDLPNVIKQVANFLEEPLTEKQVAVLAKHLSFESMKSNPAVNCEDIVEFNRKMGVTDDKEGVFMRSGKVGGYKVEMTEEMIKRFDICTSLHTKDTELIFEE